MTTAPQTVAITGATGFIGSAVMAGLLARGVRVAALLRPDSNRARTGSMRGFEPVVFHHLGEPGLAARLGALKPDVFIHCAWRGVGGGERNAAYQITENLPLTIDSVALAAATGCRQWIGLGSQAEYGNLNRIIDEATLERPTTIYGKAKLAAGQSALALCEALGLAGAWLRVFSTYGPDDTPQWFIPSTIQSFLAGRPPRLTRCEQRWDFLHVDDAARAVAAAADGRLAGVYNLGSGRAELLREVVELMRAEIGTAIEPEYGAIPYRPDQVMHLQADIRKLTGATGWSPQVRLVEGLRETIAAERKRFERATSA